MLKKWIKTLLTDESTLYDLHAGLIGLAVNVATVFVLSYVYKQSDSEIIKAQEFNEI